MIRTLRITSIITVVLAVVFFVLPAVFGVRGDEQIEQFLNSAGAIEEFNDSRGDEAGDSRHEASPLVKQAEAFALYLNPPPKPQPQLESLVSRDIPRPKKPVSAKFRLVGTSYYVLHPDLSLALIDEPGKGLRWVRQSSGVGHLIIEQIKDGIVVVRDGERTFEIVAERPEKRSLLKKDSSVQEKASPVRGGIRKKTTLSKEAEAERRETFDVLKSMLLERGESQTVAEPVETDSEPNNAERITSGRRRRRVPSRETMRISSEEAKKLGRLGQRLNNAQKGLNRTKPNKAEVDANLHEPNFGDVSNLE